MKVLFAVSNEEISESIVKKYQKEYKEIISYKNVYYFNAILKELQKDKSYDRIVISEDLENFTHTQYDQIDKFIFDRLDGISDEASNSKGDDIPIILICGDRRTKSEQILVKLFGIGIYNAIIGNDRSIDEVCKLIYRPRSKKEAKIYYKIDVDDVNYQAENENDVSEVEIQNILAHYKRLGKNEERYVESFDNIAAQYNDTQLRIISKFLPLNVRAVLEENSPKYQKVMSFNNTVSDNLRKNTNTVEKSGPSEKLLTNPKKEINLSNPIVIPSSVDTTNVKKLAKVKQKEQPQVVGEEQVEVVSEQPKRRGRPRKNPIVEEEITAIQEPKKRGRPKKNVETNEEETILPGFEPNYTNNAEQEDMILPGFDDYEVEEPQAKKQNLTNDYNKQNYDISDYSNSMFANNQNSILPKEKNYVKSVDLSYLLAQNKKIVTFVGTSKNGTSFIVNNIAEYMSSIGIDTAILDATKNRNSYYIYTKNEEELRNKAVYTLDNLVAGNAQGIRVNKNLTVYTSLPDEKNTIENVDVILETLLKTHTLVLIDCDFETPRGYFEQSQEIYLIQSFDVLTIQPLTAFLRELKERNILEQDKIKIILNKYVRIRGVSEKTIIGGMAFYNDPAMSFMTELFDRNSVKYITIPFEEDIYARYLENVINCDIQLKGFSKTFMQILKELGNMVFPLVSGRTTYNPPSVGYNTNGGFSESMNNTLNQMKRNY